MQVCSTYPFNGPDRCLHRAFPRWPLGNLTDSLAGLKQLTVDSRDLRVTPDGLSAEFASKPQIFIPDF
jgi:hypothetical protein